MINKETVKFNAKNSQVGDRLNIRVSALTLQNSHGSRGAELDFIKSMNIELLLSEILCCRGGR
jgi:hypothetical protein